MGSLTSTVLMSVYSRVSTIELRQSLGSLINQTRLPDQIVIVIDGPVSDEIQSILSTFQTQSSIQVELVQLEVNGGLVKALNIGLSHCNGDWIIRMDADDIALANRIETQLTVLELDSTVDVLGSAMYEFTSDPSKPDRLKPCKTQHRDIVQSLAMRNPVNHPTVCIRRTLLESVGGYPQLPLLEDYFLWAKLIQKGATFKNLAEPLYLFRFDDATLQRRGGLGNFKNEVWLRRWMHQQGLISLPQLCFSTLLQVLLRFAPLSLRRWFWHRSRQSGAGTMNVPSSF